MPSLVTPAGISELDVGDPADAINRVAARIRAEQLADVIIVENHDGAGAGTPEGGSLEQEVAAGGPFARLVTQTSADVDAIFNGHTHREYAWNAPAPDGSGRTRPIIQTGSYGENISRMLTVDTSTRKVIGYRAGNVKRTTALAADLTAAYPRVGAVDGIVTEALIRAAEIGSLSVW